MDLDQLLTDAPPIHGDITHALIPQALQRIVDIVKPGDHTIETGSGHSTIAFALSGAVHTCIVLRLSRKSVQGAVAENGAWRDEFFGRRSGRGRRPGLRRRLWRVGGA